MGMDIQQLITKELIVFDDTIRSKDSLFECLGDRLEASGRIKNSKKIIKDFLKRESEISTGIEEGFGIPHAKSKYALVPTLCFIHSGRITDYVGIDEQPIECVFAIAVPKHSADEHLEILSSLSRRLIDPTFRQQLKKAVTATEVLAILNQ
jgi:PTS system fructose-specific IIA component